MKPIRILLFLLCILFFSFVGSANTTYSYPRRFEILENKDNELKIKVGELVNGKKEYYVKPVVHYKNKEIKLGVKKITINGIGSIKYTVDTASNSLPFSIELVECDSILSCSCAKCDINENAEETFDDFTSGVVTFSFYTSNPCAFHLLNKPAWEQDVFVMKPIDKDLKNKIDALAKKYAPVVLMHKDEVYYPATLEYLTGTQTAVSIKNPNVDLKFSGTHFLHFKRIKNITRTTKSKKDHQVIDYPRRKKEHKRIKSFINFPVRDTNLCEILPYNGDNESVFDSIYIFNIDDLRFYYENKMCNKNETAIYYSCFQLPERNQIIINYHFLYAYDSKNEKRKILKVGSHVFDRESISVVFDTKQDELSENSTPGFVIYAGHLSNQVLKHIKSTQEWDKGRIRVEWDDIIKVGSHPVVAVAKGAHALYPIPDDYEIHLSNEKVSNAVHWILNFAKKFIPLLSSYDLKDDANYKKILFPPEVEIKENYRDNKDIWNYELIDLKLGNITTNDNAHNKILAFSGFLIDMPGLKNAKFPPFTYRELNMDDWVNGTDTAKGAITVWQTSEKLNERKREIENDLCHKVKERLSDKLSSYTDPR
ncbi:MAG: hypothetical protein ACUZ8O_02080 [Candidatus Anammoxibacter sp.]